MRIFILILLSLANLAAATKTLNEADARVYQNLEQFEENYDDKSSNVFKEKINLSLLAQMNKKSILIGELFYVDVVVKSSYKQELNAEINFNKSVDLQILNEKAKFHFQDGSYSARIYMQAKSQNAKLSGVVFNLFRNTQKVASISKRLPEFQIEELKAGKNYANLIAKNLSTKNLKCTVYDDESTLCSFNVLANDAIFSNLNFDFAINQSVTNIAKDYENASAQVSLVLNNKKNDFAFTYYEPDLKQFKSIKQDIKIIEQDINTDTKENTFWDKFGFYLQIAALICALICLIIVAITRKFFGLLALALIFVVYGFYEKDNTKNGVLKAESNILILPTERSSIILKTINDETVKISSERNGFSKIELENKTSGWVKNENLK